GGLKFVHVDAAAIVTLSDGEAGNGIAFERDHDPVLGPLAPALAADLFREVAGQDDFRLRLWPDEVFGVRVRPGFGVERGGKRTRELRGGDGFRRRRGP